MPINKLVELWNQAQLVLESARMGVSTVTAEMVERAKSAQENILKEDPGILEKLKTHSDEIEETRRKFRGPESE